MQIPTQSNDIITPNHGVWLIERKMLTQIADMPERIKKKNYIILQSKQRQR